MKSSLKKLKGFALHHHHRHDGKDKRDLLNPSAQLDELAQASQDMLDMRNCYDTLLSAAAATANSAYEFSESLREMGTCLLEKTALNDDEESGRALLMLGKVQFELQKLVDSYRSHIFQTITTPSESLLNELRTVEEMKRQCDEKRNVYEYMLAAHREKGKSKTSKGETFSSQQLQMAHEEYDEEATLFVFRLKSLKQGQTRSLLTQAARHHAAQVNFFSKGLKSLEAVDPQVRSVTERQHIDYQFSGLEDDDGEDGYDDDGQGYDGNDDGELSFDYGQNDHRLDVSASRNSMELDQVDLSLLPQVSIADTAQENIDRSYPDLQTFHREPKTGSHSAPIFPEKKYDTAERIRQLRPSASRKFHTYVLPTPLDAKSTIPARLSNPAPSERRASMSSAHNLWYSSPLEPRKYEKDSRDDKLLGLSSIKAQSVLKESNINSVSNKLPPPLAEGFSLPQYDPRTADTKKPRRNAYSGPIPSKSWSTKPSLSSSGPITSMEHPGLVPGMLSRVPLPTSSPPKVSPSASPPLLSSPKISELHELPRPPTFGTSSTKMLPLVGHSAPLGRSQDISMTNKTPLTPSNAASPLPMPPQTVPRSFSIPSSGQRAMALHVAKLLETDKEKAEEAASPPLTPISLANTKPVLTNSEVVRTAPRGGGD